MTARGNSKRPPVPNDAFYTPTWFVRQCMDHVVPVVLRKEPKRILEPGAGLGHFVVELRARFKHAEIHAVEIDKTGKRRLKKAGADKVIITDFRTFLPGIDRAYYDFACGNPPFSLAKDFVERSLCLSEVVTLLVRQGFMSSAERVRWFRENRPSHVHLAANRPAFHFPEDYLEKYPEDEYGKLGTDSADYCFISWRRGYKGKTEMDWLPDVSLEERREG